MIRHAALSALLLLAMPNPLAADSIETANNYPTVAVVDYVLGCMRANGQTRHALEACSCSIDVIASILPYERYERAATFKSMSLMTGEGAGLFRKAHRRAIPATNSSGRRRKPTCAASDPDACISPGRLAGMGQRRGRDDDRDFPKSKSRLPWKRGWAVRFTPGPETFHGTSAPDRRWPEGCDFHAGA